MPRLGRALILGAYPALLCVGSLCPEAHDDARPLRADHDEIREKLDPLNDTGFFHLETSRQRSTPSTQRTTTTSQQGSQRRSMSGRRRTTTTRSVSGRINKPWHGANGVAVGLLLVTERGAPTTSRKKAWKLGRVRGLTVSAGERLAASGVVGMCPSAVLLELRPFCVLSLPPLPFSGGLGGRR